MRKIAIIAATLGVGLSVPAMAQEPAPAPTPTLTACPAGMTCQTQPLPSSELGLTVFPAKGQPRDLQFTEEQQCYAWAKENTGIDPALVKANPDSAAKVAAGKAAEATTGAAVGGAARGAAAGALIGAAAGDAGKGAAIGATAGAIGGRRAKKQVEGKAAAAGAQQANAQAAELINQFKKAMSACLEGKGYTVK